MRLWLGFAKREDGTKERAIVVLHFFGRHMAAGGGFRDNAGTWHEEVKNPVFCKCGREI